MFSVEDSVMRSQIERKYEFRKWCGEIPTLNFKKDWNVRIIPPFGGAIVRFTVEKGDRYVSVYLDCYDKLGCYGKPYWEIYPYAEDTYRCDMNDVEELLKRIDEALEGNDKWDNEN